MKDLIEKVKLVSKYIFNTLTNKSTYVDNPANIALVVFVLLFTPMEAVVMYLFLVLLFSAVKGCDD